MVEGGRAWTEQLAAATAVRHGGRGSRAVSLRSAAAPLGGARVESEGKCLEFGGQPWEPCMGFSRCCRCLLRHACSNRVVSAVGICVDMGGCKQCTNCLAQLHGCPCSSLTCRICSVPLLRHDRKHAGPRRLHLLGTVLATLCPLTVIYFGLDHESLACSCQAVLPPMCCTSFTEVPRKLRDGSQEQC